MQKQEGYRNRALLDLCHGAPCFLGFVGCKGGTDPNEPSVPCHSNFQSDGRGYAYKSHDHAAVPGCPHCHWVLDYGPLTRAQKEEVFRLGQRRFWHWLWTNAKIKVA